MTAISENQRSTHEARRKATESTAANLAYEPAFNRPWHAAKEEAIRKLGRKSNATAGGSKRVALEVAPSHDQETGEAADDRKLADKAADPVGAELQVLRAAELIDGL